MVSKSNKPIVSLKSPHQPNYIILYFLKCDIVYFLSQIFFLESILVYQINNVYRLGEFTFDLKRL